MAFLKPLFQIIPLALIVVGLFAYNFMNAQWAGPIASAPGSNVPTTINVSSNYQYKTGDLGAIQMRADEYCDAAGLNCYPIANLAGGGGAGITQLTGGVGIALSPTTITSTGTVGVNITYLQRRVSSVCAIGSAIRQINADGTAVCEVVRLPCQLEGVTFTSGSSCRVDTGSCGTGTQYTSLTCEGGGNWTTQSYCSSLAQAPMANCP